MDEHAIEIAAQTSAIIVKDTLESLYTPLSKFINVNRAKFLDSFSAYCEYMMAKNSMVRTLYSKSKPMSLSDVYVKTHFSIDDDNGTPIRFSDADLTNKFAIGKRIIIKGHGGSGKTIFLKHLWVTRFKNSSGKIPIYIELRRLNDLQTLDIATFCRLELQADAIFGNGVFEKLCESGKFEFIFDGFDEVARGKRKLVERQILDLAEKYRGCNILISGREDDRFSGWGTFEIYTVAPLNIEDLKNLINNIPFDWKVKKKFLETLTDEFYKTHHSFLSSPLLAIMMLMTFNENAIIPSKLTTFYNHAFQTLLTWHDATKDSFERERSLTIDEFRKVFSTLCLISYYEQAFEFDEPQLRKFIDKSLSYHRLETSIDLVLNDICESVNLIQKEGLVYIFVHRSFQEYFAAECAMQVVSGKANDFLVAFAKRPHDSAFYMCYELHPELVFDKYLEAKIDEALSSPILEPKKKSRWHHTNNVLDKLTLDLHISNGALVIGNIGYVIRKQNEQVLLFIDLCNRMRQVSSIKDPGFETFISIIRPLQSAISQTNLPDVSDAHLKVTISATADNFKISCTNAGQEKVSQKSVNQLKSLIKAGLTDKTNQAEVALQRTYTATKRYFEELRAERAAKLKSIDDILGM